LTILTQSAVPLFYDGSNQLIQIFTGDKTAEYTYTGDGLRRSKTVNGTKTTHIWDGDSIVLELDNADAVAATYIRGINLPKILLKIITCSFLVV